MEALSPQVPKPSLKPDSSSGALHQWVLESGHGQREHIIYLEETWMRFLTPGIRTGDWRQSPPEDMSHQEYEEEIAGGLRLPQSVR